MKRWFAEPLVQFILLGSILYLLFDFSRETKPSNEIIVDMPTLETYLQYQTRRFTPGEAAQTINNMSPEQRSELADSYIRDEVLYREAINNGLDRNDEIVRRRLIQKMEYIVQGFNEGLPEITEVELQTYFHANRLLYGIDASISFTHVFVSSKDPDRKNVARMLLDRLNKLKVPFERAGGFGERFIYNRNYMERTPDYLQSHFGTHFQEQIFELNVSEKWQGPIESDYGDHLVLIRNKSSARIPGLSEVASMVLADASKERQRQFSAKAIENLKNKYRISNLTSHP